MRGLHAGTNCIVALVCVCVRVYLGRIASLLSSLGLDFNFRAKEAKKIPLYDKNSSYFLAKKGRQESGGVGGLEASTLCTGSRLRPPTGSQKSRFPESILLRLRF